jgi:hypothetical protein
MKSILKQTLLGATIGAIALVNTNALPITPSTGILNTSRWEGDNQANLNANQIAGIVGLTPGDLTERYKNNVDDGEEGSPFDASYTTTYFNLPGDPEEATIHWDGDPNPFINTIPKYLYVKDGNSDPAFYVFDITSWDGKEDLVLTEFWPGNGAISHIAILSGDGIPPSQTPDGGATAALLGLGFLGLAAMSRKRA